MLTLLAIVGLSRSGTASPHLCKATRNDLAALDLQIQRYVTEEGHLPPEASWALELHERGLLRSSETPTDRWGHPIIFEWHDDRGDSYELMTVGHDGERGTADDQIRASDWAHTGPCRVPRGHSWCGF